jgi:hypothetical protein
MHTADPGRSAEIVRGHVHYRAFPLILLPVMGAVNFRLPFCVGAYLYTMKEPDEARLAEMVSAHFTELFDEPARQLVRKFWSIAAARGGSPRTSFSTPPT